MWKFFLPRMHAVWFSVLVFVLAVTSPAGATIVHYDTVLGTFDVRMFDSVMLNTVANFKSYINANPNRYEGTFVHRSIANFVIQGGGFTFDEDTNSAPGIELFPPIDDEPGGGVAGPSNVRGTIAMAKSGPDTVTSQWFINLGDNSSLDNPTRPDGGFSAFGRVLENGMDVVDAIAALPIFNLDPFPQTLFDTVPLRNVAGGLAERLVFVNSITELNLPAGDYDFDSDVDGTDFLVWQRTFGSTTLAEADGNGNVVIDTVDLAIWQDTYGTVASSSAIASIPEPSTLGMALLGGFLLLKRKRCQLRMVRA
jgi:peptidyl-prolyl cis-trans isomerase A (cyclophilin A)